VTAAEALSACQRLIIATHVPPFLEAALYQGKPSEPAFAPHFVNLAMGNAILELARQNPKKRSPFFVVIPTTKPVIRPSQPYGQVAGAEYNQPAVAETIMVPLSP